MKVVSKMVAKMSLNTAKKAVNRASDWFMYQTKETRKVKEMLRK